MKRPSIEEMKKSIDEAIDNDPSLSSAFMMRPIDFTEKTLKIEFVLMGKGKQVREIPRIKE